MSTQISCASQASTASTLTTWRVAYSADIRGRNLTYTQHICKKAGHQPPGRAVAQWLIMIMRSRTAHGRRAARPLWRSTCVSLRPSDLSLIRSVACSESFPLFANENHFARSRPQFELSCRRVRMLSANGSRRRPLPMAAGMRGQWRGGHRRRGVPYIRLAMLRCILKAALGRAAHWLQPAGMARFFRHWQHFMPHRLGALKLKP